MASYPTTVAAAELISRLFLTFCFVLVFCSSVVLRVRAQQDGEVRLVNGPTSNVGRVEIYYDGKWGTMCDDSWHIQDANVICKQLGYESASQVVYRAGFGQGTGPIWVDQIDCKEEDQPKSILDCSHNGWGIHDCKHREDAGVHCNRKNPVKPSFMHVGLSCPDHTQDGTCTACPHKRHPEPGDCSLQVAVQGIVMAHYNDEWKPITAEGWDFNSARVVCGELGYPVALGIPTLEELWSNWDGQHCASQSVGSGDTCSPGEITENDSYRENLKSTWLKELECSGKERRTLDCYFPEFGSQSNPGLQVATVRCGFLPHSSCPFSTTEAYRTRGSPVPWKGRVEAKVNGEWGTICDNQWSFEDASVVCRAMGYGTAQSVGYRANYGRGVGKIHYSRLLCQGDEQTLSECVKETGAIAQSCGHQGDAGIVCNVPRKCEPPKKGRIVTEADPLNPDYKYDYIEVNGDSGWGMLCFESLQLQTANVVCRENKELFALRIRSGNRQGYAGVRYRGFVTCSGDEGALEECSSVSFEAVSSCTSGDSIVDCSASLPDLVPDLRSFETSLQYYPYVDRQPMYYLTCAHEEKCLSSSADGKPLDHTRNLLRFNSQTMNYGMMDFLPVLQSHEWIWHSCHNHFHSFEAFIHYDLLNVTTGEKVAEGHKASFCLEDSFCEAGSSRYRCGTGTQGISVNCGDLYGRHLDCQWIDITDVSPGTYILRQIVNPERLTMETNYLNNKVECIVNYYPGFFLFAQSCKLSDH